jgi:hypothetical protein
MSRKSLVHGRRVGLVAAATGVCATAALVLALGAGAAAVELKVGELLVVNATATGTVSGLQPNTAITIDGQTHLADASGVVTLTSTPLDADGVLTIGYGGSTIALELKDALTGLPLTADQIADLLPNTTLPITETIDLGGSTGASSGSGGTGGGVGGAGSSGAVAGGSAAPAGAIVLPSGETSILAASVTAPARFVIDKVQFSPLTVRSRTKPITARIHVSDTRGFVVRGALVYLRGIPARRLRPVGERPTGTDGWVTFRLNPTRLLPLKAGARLTMFARARKPGENALAGASTRRLVSLRLSRPSGR